MMAMSLMPIFRLVITPMTTASDASSTGMPVVRLAVFTVAGKAALANMRGAATAAARERVGLVDLFGGVGGARGALELIGIEPAVHVHVENNPTASGPCAFRHGTIEAIDDRDVKRWVAAGPHVSVWIVFGDFSLQIIYCVFSMTRTWRARGRDYMCILVVSPHWYDMPQVNRLALAASM